MYRRVYHNVVQLTIILVFVGHVHNFLIYPPGGGTILQFTATLSVPAELVDGRRLFVDIGFQIYYSLLNNSTYIYTSPIWPDKYSRRKRQMLSERVDFDTSPRQLEWQNGAHPNDFTAGELYTSFESFLEDYGFHKSCMLRSVCELALHPLDQYHNFNAVLEVLTFILTPSQHEGFAEDEILLRKKYEEAERIGFLGGDCTRAYPKCDKDVLSLITNLII